jgi:uncharacterized protein YyaL (SSP411 family)
MDEGADVTKVEWREWGAEAFEVAERRGAPVLLALTTPWSADCREMDETTYAEPRIAANINDGFVPVRVDADRHPRIRERYVMGGFPSTLFLTPAGEILSGATFLGPAGFRGILDSVRGAWDARGEAAGSIPRTLTEAAPPGGTLSERVEEHMVEQLLAAYDDEFGGWGTDVKFPLPRTIEFALVRAPDQATRTLEAIQTHLLDTYDGGFYRLAHNRNWRDARREKLVDENAAVLRAFAHGYRYTGEESYLETATSTLEYLTTTAWTGEAFAASQAAADDYYTLEPTEREAADAPTVDETVLADRNGLAIDALLALAAYTDDERARSYARRARDHVVETLVDADGRVTHVAPEAAGTDEPVPSGLLLDQARLLQGLTRSWAVLGEPGPAEAVADWTIEHLQHESGAFRDGPQAGAGLLDRPLYPLDTTVECADALLTLSHLAGEERYAAAARDALSAFAGAADRMGVEVATYASAVARTLDPQVVAVATPAGSDLHRAALRLADHETTVVPAADGPAAGTAEVRSADQRRGTAEAPAALEALLTDV